MADSGPTHMREHRGILQFMGARAWRRCREAFCGVAVADCSGQAVCRQQGTKVVEAQIVSLLERSVASLEKSKENQLSSGCRISLTFVQSAGRHEYMRACVTGGAQA